MQIPSEARPCPWYAQLWPWLLMLGPVAVILAGSYTSWLAFSRPDALVVDDYYKRGKAINQDLRRDHVAQTLGLSSTLRYDPAAGKLSGSLHSFGKPLPLTEKIQLRLVHSTQPEKDLILVVQPDRYGTFMVALPMLEKARWQVVLENLLENESRAWRLTSTWAWPKEPQMTLKADPAVLD